MDRFPVVHKPVHWSVCLGSPVFFLCLSGRRNTTIATAGIDIWRYPCSVWPPSHHRSAIRPSRPQPVSVGSETEHLDHRGGRHRNPAFSLWIHLCLRKVALVPIMVLSLAYALPVFPGKKRLRDYPYIKIFLIGSLWTLLTIGIPVMHANTYSWYIITLLLLERFLFIFSLTIPFDLRDIRVDQEHKVWTIPMVLGIKWAKRLSMSLLLAALLLLGFLVYHFHVWSPRAYTILILTYGVAGWLIYKSKSHGSDYFFSIFIDGVMILPLLFEISWYYLHQLWHWIQ